MAASPETAAKKSIAGRSQRPARYPTTNLALKSPIKGRGEELDREEEMLRTDPPGESQGRE